MNAAIRRITLVLALALAALFVNLNVVQLVRSEELTDHPRNDRAFLRNLGIRRGEILAADGAVLAESVRTKDDRFPWRRRYPLGDLFGHITGYYAPSRICRSSGLEDSMSAYLTGDQPETAQNFVDELLGREPDGNVLKLTIDPAVQRVAARALGDQGGSVAALDPRTGAVLALYSTPTYNPNSISRGNPDECGRALNRLESTEGNPLRLRATAEWYPPGSTFKILVSATALQGRYSPSSSFPFRTTLNLPDTDRTLGNFGGSSCGGSLASALRVSCNTTFAELGMALGPKRLGTMADRFGFGADPGIELPDVSVIPSCFVAVPGVGCGDPATVSRPGTAYSSIGQQDVRVTALQMAMVAATVSSSGILRQPYLVSAIEDPTGKPLIETEPRPSDRIYSRKTARELKQMMIDVVRSGTGAVVGFQEASRGIIGGKTGTAQTGIPGEAPHVWFVAFAPNVAVAVVVENGGNLADAATGGRVAGPIAKAVLERVRSMRGRL